MCDDFLCLLHDKHVFECDCPSLEDLLPVDPYLDPPEKVRERIEEIPSEPQSAPEKP